MTYTHYIFDNGMAARLTLHEDGMMDMERYDPMVGKLVSDFKLIKKIDSDDCNYKRVSLDEFWDYIWNERFDTEINKIINPENS